MKRKVLLDAVVRRNYLTCLNALFLQLDVLFGNLPEMVEFQVEFLKTLEDGTRLVPDLEKLERVDQFKVRLLVKRTNGNGHFKLS